MAFELYGMLAGNVSPIRVLYVFFYLGTPYIIVMQEAARGKREKSKHSQWRNYDDLNAYFWSADSFRLGWPIADADFFCRHLKSSPEKNEVFICEQKLYTKAQLDQHKSTGDSEVDETESERGGFMGHPFCEFCRNPFYGDNELFMHISTEHFKCFICEKQHPGQYDYFRNYNDLEVTSMETEPSKGSSSIGFRKDLGSAAANSCRSMKDILVPPGLTNAHSGYNRVKGKRRWLGLDYEVIIISSDDESDFHFRHEHFLCENENCLEEKFVVFQTEAEMKRHNTLKHAGHMSRSQRNAALQIPTSFTYRRNEQEQRRRRDRGHHNDHHIEFTYEHYEHGDARPITRETNQSEVPSLESLNINPDAEPPRSVLQAHSSRISPIIEESSFPPLSDREPSESSSRYAQVNCSLVTM